MKKLEYEVSFATPAFLGNAHQAAQWRTPPFKALIRHWWRIVKAPEVGFDVSDLRKAEGRLFGIAADDGDSRRSLLRLRLSNWSPGGVSSWTSDKKLPHPEVTTKAGKVMAIGSQLYLGYGPLTFAKGGTALSDQPARTAIAVDATQTLTIAVPNEFASEVIEAIQLCAWFGALGSRAKNGWGSFQLTAKGETPPIPELGPTRLKGLKRPLDECLTLSWPHAIGADEGQPLVWQTPAMPTWPALMRELAAIKIAFRTEPGLMSLDGVPNGSFAARHLLAYPVTHHKVSGNEWGNQGRLANQIRFKAAKGDGGWIGTIVHTPCRLPEKMVSDLPQPIQRELGKVSLTAWRQVHAILDSKAQRMQAHD
ncbi:hypothetical protein [Thiorhodococcus minor]|uniref:Type III-B CRISPR module RAMP protein Cmr1 n=1 Tax=Thiorhodococcus minor TaxID=57489 RepID=A0A6M0K3Q0_9GAMM|nr:hypothetical protein [Thiorhodococcus minor]NEV64428.1 hypothetical protein [Thiorhodococcus minor]